MPNKVPNHSVILLNFFYPFKLLKSFITIFLWYVNSFQSEIEGVHNTWCPRYVIKFLLHVHLSGLTNCCIINNDLYHVGDPNSWYNFYEQSCKILCIFLFVCHLYLSKEYDHSLKSFEWIYHASVPICIGPSITHIWYSFVWPRLLNWLQKYICFRFSILQ